MGWKTKEQRRTYARDYYGINKEALLASSRLRQRVTLSVRRRSHPSLFLFRAARRRAKEKGLPFNLEARDIVIPTFCPMLGILMSPNHGAKKHAPHSPTLDRIDPTKGYVKGNVRVISYMANAMKRDATPEQLRIFAFSVLLDQGLLELDY